MIEGFVGFGEFRGEGDCRLWRICVLPLRGANGGRVPFEPPYIQAIKCDKLSLYP